MGLEWCGELLDLAYGGENGESLGRRIYSEERLHSHLPTTESQSFLTEQYQH